MMLTFEMGPEFNSTVARLSSMGRAIVDACSKGLEKGSVSAASNVAENYLTDQALKTRSGMLKKAVDGWLAGPLDAEVGVRPNSAVDKYKWLLGDEQKTIESKRPGGFLAIPILGGEALTGAGVLKGKYSGGLRSISEGFFVKSKGRLLFGFKRGKKGKFRPLFTLVKSVLVQGTGALYDGVMDSLDDIGEAIETEIGKVTEN